jgi:hypothetical protein
MGDSVSAYYDDLADMHEAVKHFGLDTKIFRKYHTSDDGTYLVRDLRITAPKLTTEQVTLLVKQRYEHNDKAREDRQKKDDLEQLVKLLDKYGLPEEWATKNQWGSTRRGNFTQGG